MRFKLFKYLLKWYCEKELDQWERWKINTKYGYVFITVDRSQNEFNLNNFVELK